MKCINCNFEIPDDTDDYYNIEHTKLECPKCNYTNKVSYQDRENGQVDTVVSSADRWFERNLKCLLGGQITLIEQGKQKNIDRKKLADWIISHC